MQHHLVAFLLHLQRQRAGGGLARGTARRGGFDAVHHCIADQVLDRAGHAVQHRAVDFHGAALDQQAHFLAGLSRGLACHAIEALGQRVELHHARLHQPALHAARQARLRGQVAGGAVKAALQVLLDGGHVVDRLGHHPRQLLEAREAVELERIEFLLVLRVGNARRHLRFRLDLDFAQLPAQARDVVVQFAQVGAHRLQFAVQACARGADFAGFIDQRVERARLHTHQRALRLGGHGRRHRHHHVCRSRHGGQAGGGHRLDDGICLRQRRIGLRVLRHLGQAVDQVRVVRGQQAAGRQRLDMRQDAVVPGIEPLEQLRPDGLLPLPAQAGVEQRLHFMRGLAQRHGTRHARTALERMQRAQHQAAVARIFRRCFPAAQQLAQFGQRALCLFQEDLDQGGIRGAALVRYRRNGRPVRGRQRDNDRVMRCGRQLCGLRSGQCGRLRLVFLRRRQLAQQLRHRAIRLGRRLRRGHRHARTQQRALAKLNQAAAQTGIGFRPDARGKLVQHAAQALDRLLQQAEIAGVHRHRVRAQLQQQGLQRLGDLTHGFQADGGRTALQRVGDAQPQFARARMAFMPPFGDVGGELAQQVVGLLQVDVVERQPDAHRPDDLVVVVLV
ncbi:hypothetical protein D9M72_309760 [compost metagenome]